MEDMEGECTPRKTRALCKGGIREGPEYLYFNGVLPGGKETRQKAKVFVNKGILKSHCNYCPRTDLCAQKTRQKVVKIFHEKH